MSEDWSALVKEDLQKLTEVVISQSAKTEKLIPGERRTVAILFCDLKGFTALSETIDHEMVHRITGGVMQVLSRVIEGHGGYVDKFEGDQIMALFGAKVAAENDCVRSVAAGLKMLESIKDVNKILMGKGIELGARIGINFGPVTVAPDPSGHLTAMGDEVNLASRMESTAEVNTVQVTEVVEQSAGDAFTWKDLGEISVKGKKQPVHIFRPEGLGEVQKERWKRTSRVSPSQMLGRGNEIKILEEAFSKETVPNLRGFAKHRVIGMSGDAGIGKSRLCHEFIKNCDAVVLSGVTRSYAQPPYWLWITLLRDYFGIGDDDPDKQGKLDQEIEDIVNKLSSIKGTTSLQRNLSHNKPFLGQLLSISYDDDRFKMLDDKAKNLETVLSLRFFIRAIALIQRTIILLEDFQWIDTSSLDALKNILGNTDTPEPILFLCPHRSDGELPDVHSNYVDIEEIELKPINDSFCRGLMRHMLGGGNLPSETEDLILSRVSGNPFYLEETVMLMVERKIIQQENGSWVQVYPLTEADIPHTLNSLILARIDSLDPELKNVLKRASIIGQEFLVTVLSRINKKLADIEETEKHVEWLEKLELIVRSMKTGDATYLFKQSITRDVTYNILLHHDRRVLHRICAEIMEDLFPDKERFAAIIADHWDRSEVNVDKAVEWGLKALESCRKSYQSKEGLSWAIRIKEWLETWEENRERDELLYEVLMIEESIHELLGQTGERHQLLERMLEICNKWTLTRQKAQALNSLGNLQRLTGQMDEAISCYKDALEIYREVEDSRGEGHVLTSLGMLHKTQGRLHEALDCYQQALKIYRSTGDRGEMGGVLGSLGVWCKERGSTEDAKRYYDEALQITRETGNRMGEGKMLINLGALHRSKSEMDEALKYYQAALDIHREVGDRVGEGITLNHLGVFHHESGQRNEALRYHNQALEIHREVEDRRSEGVTLGNIGVIYYAQGRIEESLKFYRQALEIHRSVGYLVGEGNVLDKLGLLYRRIGSIEEAIEYYKEALEIHRKVGDKRHEGITLNNLGALNRSSGQLNESHRNYEMALDIFRKGHNIAAQGKVLQHLGHLYLEESDINGALEKFLEALGKFEECGNQRFQAKVLGQLGTLYHKLGRNDDSLDCFQKSLDIHHSVGDRKSEMTMLRNLAILHRDLGQKDRALENFNKACLISRQDGCHSDEADILVEMGFLQAKSGLVEEAVISYNNAERIITKHSLFDSFIIELEELKLMLQDLGEL